MSNISTYEDLEKRIRALERKLQVEKVIQAQQEEFTDRKPQENKLKNVQEDLYLLYNAAKAFAELPLDSNIYSFIAEQFSKLSDNSAVIVSTFDKSSYSLVTQAEFGAEKFSQMLSDKAGRHLTDEDFELSDYNIGNYKKGKLLSADEGIYELSFNIIPKAICTEIEQSLNIKSSYTIGLASKRELFGVAMILSYKPEIANPEIIESFAGLSAIEISRKQKEAEIREKNEYLAASLKSTGDAVITTNKSGQVVFMNPSAEKYCGWKVENARGRHLKDVFKTSDKDDRSAKLISKSGAEYAVSYKTTPILNDGGEVLGELIEFYDSSLAKVSETELLEAKKKAEESDKLKSAYLANMAHEIRSPMNAIVGFSSLLSEDDVTEEDRKDYINLINISCANLSNLINDIIDIAKIEAGQIKINISEFNVLDILEEVCDTYKGILKKDNKTGVEIRLDKGSFKDVLMITSDPFRIRQILINLVGNANKFTETGFIEIGVKIKDDDNLLFSVKDTGQGIKPHELGLIFERFKQSENNDVKKHGGTGLGLAISKNLTKLLGGDMWAESEFGKGSAFCFTLPYKQPEIKPEIIVAKPEIKELLDWSDKTILVVEDVEINYVLIKEYLRKTKAKFLIARDGQQAVDICKSNDDIDVILMDIQMPVMNGYIATKKIKELNKNIPVIAETAYAMANEKKEILDAGCDDYLAKPLRSEEMLKVVGKYIDVRANSLKS